MIKKLIAIALMLFAAAVSADTVPLSPYTNVVRLSSGGSPTASWYFQDSGELTIFDNVFVGYKVDTSWVLPRGLHAGWPYWIKVQTLDGDWGAPGSQHLYLIGAQNNYWFNGSLSMAVSCAGTGFHKIGHFRVDVSTTNSSSGIVQTVIYGVDLQR